MALAYSHIKILYQLRKLGILNMEKPSLIEFGEQNWFGDVSYTQIPELARALDHSENFSDEIQQRLDKIVAEKESNPSYLFDIAKLFYKMLFDYEEYSAIDLHGTSAAKKMDLNEPIAVGKRYDIVTNLGTGEHVFNQYMFFKNLHDVTKENGFMIHSMPNQGCYDHGFFNYHPTFVFDLIAANDYLLHSFVLLDTSTNPPSFSLIPNRETYVQLAVDNKLSGHSGIFSVFQKPNESKEFRIPRQGYYDDQLSDELRQAWAALPK